MVKFGERAATEVVPEWAQAYVSYPRLTALTYEFCAKHPSPSEADLLRFERLYLAAVEDELEKADQHFINIISDLEAKCAVLRAHGSPVTPPDSGYSGLETPTSSPLAAVAAARRRARVTFADALANHSGTASAESAPLVVRSGGDRAASVGDGGSPNTTPPTGPAGTASIVRMSAVHMGTSSNTSLGGSDTSSSLTKAAFQDWFHQAESLQRFAELAAEAVRKSAKKLEKNVQGAHVKHLASLAVERRQLFQASSDLHGMISLVKLEYEHRFHRVLEQFKDAEIKIRPSWRPKYQMLLAAVCAFAVTLMLPILATKPEAHACLALFALTITLWISEAFPYFATALLIPLVAVPLQVIRDPATHEAAPPDVAARMLLAKMFESVQILVLGGLTMAKALDKSQLATAAEAYLHRRTARSPHLYMLGVMVTGCCLCCFVSNVAAPVLVLGVIRRTLLRMPRGANRAAPQRAMLLGLAFACNLGGMLSPIASPQNAVALHVLLDQGAHSVSFAKWILVTLPFVAAMLTATWLLLLRLLKPFDGMEFVPLPDTAKEHSPLSTEQRGFVGLLCLLTVFLWCFDPNMLFGSPAMVALLPIVGFFGFGILEKDDFNTLSWHLMFLLAGGSMLGLCAQSSGLLKVASTYVLHHLHGASPMVVISAVVLCFGVITTFVSHTVSAMVLLPLIGTLHTTATATATHVVSEHATHSGLLSAVLGGPEMGTVLVFVAVLMCSGAMAFPISSFPNVNSLLAEDEQGQPWLSANDYILPGGIITVLGGVLLIVAEPAWMALVL